MKITTAHTIPAISPAFDYCAFLQHQYVSFEESTSLTIFKHVRLHLLLQALSTLYLVYEQLIEVVKWRFSMLRT